MIALSERYRQTHTCLNLGLGHESQVIDLTPGVTILIPLKFASVFT
jgi:hypothetical protein